MIELSPKLNFDYGRIELSIPPTNELEAKKEIFIDNKLMLETIQLSSWKVFENDCCLYEFPEGSTSFNGFTYLNDYSEQGELVTYYLTDYDGNVISQKSIQMDFEDTLIQDVRWNEEGEEKPNRKVLRIPYNPKVSSFKTIVQEQKIETLGNKYPFFVRNGNLRYKEIPIGGLLSYRTELSDTYLEQSIADEMRLEREYKLGIEAWLSNGEDKILRLGPEGSYRVRITDLSFTPIEALGRRLHEFSATACEVGTMERPPQKEVKDNEEE